MQTNYSYAKNFRSAKLKLLIKNETLTDGNNRSDGGIIRSLLLVVIFGWIPLDVGEAHFPRLPVERV